MQDCIAVVCYAFPKDITCLRDSQSSSILTGIVCHDRYAEGFSLNEARDLLFAQARRQPDCVGVYIRALRHIMAYTVEVGMHMQCAAVFAM